ncbi:MAG: CRISPR-associated helicase Cas3', partial [Runella zeae]
MLTTIWAKPNKPYEEVIGETLAEHTDSLIQFWRELKKRYESTLDVADDFWYESFVAVLFHDLGKCSDNFQYLMDFVSIPENKNKQPDYGKLVRHEFLSGLFLVNLRPDLLKNPYSLFSVFTHHKAFTIDFFAGQMGEWSVKRENIQAFFDYVRVRLEEEFPKDPRNAQFFNEEATNKVIQFYEKEELANMAAMSARATALVYERAIANVKSENRKDYIYQKAMLVASDWTASQERDRRHLEKPFDFDEEKLKKVMLDRLEKAGKAEKVKSFDLMDFQKNAGAQKGDVIAIAPTGSGKTEASLLWAFQKKEFQKILYLLPTRNTCNAIYLRFKDYFGETDTAVVHSLAKLFRQNEAERRAKDEGEINDGSHSFEFVTYLRDQAFFRPITVSTIDQLLTIGFNAGEWELRTFHLKNAKVIIDEVHAYAPYTLGLLVATIQYLKTNFGTEFFVMSATLPKKLQALFQRILVGDAVKTPIIERELLNKARNTIYTLDKQIADLKGDIIKRLEEGNKVLVVVNTVDGAIDLYNSLKTECEVYGPICYHSRFTQKDRLGKEKAILDNEKTKHSKLLIATQVVEVSLDIDYDILFTENAPIDAIVQRAGRVNRERSDTRQTEVIVFKHEPVTEDVYKMPEQDYADAEQNNILSNTFSKLSERSGDRLSEQDWLDLVDEIYKDWDFESDPSYKEGLKKYDVIQRNNLNYIMDFTSSLGEKVLTREGLDTVSFIP